MQAVFPAVTPCRRSALEHTLSRVLGLDDLLIPSNLDALCDFVRHGLVSWTLIQGWAVLHCPGITHPWWSPATHQLTPQSPPCSAPLSFLFKKYFWEPTDLLRDFTDWLTYFCFDTGTKKHALITSVKLCGSGWWYQILFNLFYE